MADAMNAFQEAQLMQIAVGISDSGGLMPRNLGGQQRKVIAKLVSSINAARSNVKPTI